MSAVDNVLGMDWSDARYVGDGVYVRDASDYTGINSVAIRTDRGMDEHQVIVFEVDTYNAFVRECESILGARAPSG